MAVDWMNSHELQSAIVAEKFDDTNGILWSSEEETGHSYSVRINGGHEAEPFRDDQIIN